jgi:hypothetical protein
VNSDGFITTVDFSDLRVRIPKIGEAPRAVANISMDEIKLAMTTVAANTYGLSAEDLVEETARVLGFARRGDRIRGRMREAFSGLEAKGEIKMIDGKVNIFVAGDLRGEKRWMTKWSAQSPKRILKL